MICRQQLIRGASTKQILAALQRLMGTAVRTRGSHVFFKSQINGAILPVPAHTGSMAYPLLLSNLEAWGIPELTFAKELGLKVFTRAIGIEKPL